MTRTSAATTPAGRDTERATGAPARATGSPAAPYVAEGLATFLLVAIGPGAAMVAASTHAFGQVGIALAFALAVTLGITAFGDTSGAHMNPAVTLGLWAAGRFPLGRALPYIAVQCAAAVAAAAVLRWVLGPVANLGATVPALPVAQSFAVEAGFSALLGVVIASVASRRERGDAGPFAIGAAVGVGALVAGPLTGGSFNPARSFGPAVVSGVWTAHWLYWAAPIAGITAAMLGYEALTRSRLPRLSIRAPSSRSAESGSGRSSSRS
ncbi:MAG TPA: aquaporin [Gemmatimonadaceae bacterium]|nr:aquaporin [Gemmatimonadaceae bacterium]